MLKDWALHSAAGGYGNVGATIPCNNGVKRRKYQGPWGRDYCKLTYNGFVPVFSSSKDTYSELTVDTNVAATMPYIKGSPQGSRGETTVSD